MSLKPYKSLSSFIFRTHLKPFDDFIKFINEVGDFDIYKEPFKSYFQNPYFREAIFIASPELYKQIDRLYLSDNLSSEQIENLSITLYKYFARIHQRATPFGLFSACSSGYISDKIQFVLQGFNRSARLDMTILGELIHKVLSNYENRLSLIFYPNSSIYSINNKLRYVEFRFNGEMKKTFHVVEVANDFYLQNILEKASKGASIEALVELIYDEEISAQEAIDYIHLLIDNQLLVSNLEPKLTSENPLKNFLTQLEKIPKENKLYLDLKEVSDLINSYNNASDKHLELLISIDAKIQEILNYKSFKSAIQVDSFLSSDSSLSTDIIQDIKSGVELLACFSSINSLSSLDSFKNEFIKKYEQQEVPLVHILDSELGLNFTDFSTLNNSESPLIDQLNIPNRHQQNYHIAKSDNSSIKQLIYNQSLLENTNTVILNDQLVNKIKQSNKHKLTNLPNLISVLNDIYSVESNEDNAKTYKYYIQQISANPISRLINRFSHTHKNIAGLVTELSSISESNKSSDSILAEIIHLPENRLGNIMMRAATTAYEIPYLGASSVDNEFQININDLVVSVRDNKIVLKSTKLHKIILPSLNTAYNFHKSTLPIFKFLCILQYQNFSNYIWDWGHLASNLFLPRIEYKNQIISPAFWNISLEAIKLYFNLESVSIENMKEYFAQFNFPSNVLLVENEDELIFNLNLPICNQIIYNTLVKNKQIIIKEYIGPFSCKNKDGMDIKHHIETVLFFNKSTDENLKLALKTDENDHSSIISPKRYFPIGSEYLYIKVYTGEKTADDFLVNILYPVCKLLLEKKIIQKWFFIRYKDPDNHIRIRFFNEEKQDFWKEIMDVLNEPFNEWQEKFLIQKIEYNTYQREIERYGPHLIEDVENLFGIHADLILDLLVQFEDKLMTDIRWQLVLKTIDIILDLFEYSLEEKLDLLNLMSTSYEKEFGLAVSSKKQLSNQYRLSKKTIEDMLSQHISENIILANYSTSLNRFKNHSKLIIQKINNQLIHKKEKTELVWNLLHMMCNRSFNSNQRKHELVIYQYLYNYYKSQHARTNSNKIN